MDDLIPISFLNDFIFCPVSIYFHQLYGSQERLTYQCSDQINGTAAHKTVDSSTYSTRKNVLQGISVYSEKLHLIGKTDIFYKDTGILVERKKRIKTIYDGYVFQIYAQCYCLREMGYTVSGLKLYSMDDNKTFAVPLPENDSEMNNNFLNVIHQIKTFMLENFQQNNIEKCRHCIYEPACDRSLL